MEIFGTNKRDKEIKLKCIDIMLSIKEIDKLIEFFTEAKSYFCERINDKYVSKLVKRDNEFCIENISSYSKLIELGYEHIEDHVHYINENEADSNAKCDIIVHTMFKATSTGGDKVEWTNDEV